MTPLHTWKTPLLQPLREFRKADCHAYVDRPATVSLVVSQLPDYCRTPHELFACNASTTRQVEYSTCRLLPTGQALAPVRAQCARRHCFAPTRSETLSDLPAKCSCDVRPVKVKPIRNMSTYSAR